MADNDVLGGLEAAVSAQPRNMALRMHLAAMLLSSGAPERALAHCRHGLTLVPGHIDALALAAQACDALGDQPGAEHYGMLLEAGEAAAAQASTMEHPEPISTESSGAAAAFAEGAPTVTLADVSGMEDVKRRLELAFLAPLRNADLRAAFGKQLRGGLLLWGPPGCGKTHIARALAGELGLSFLSVGIADVLDMYIGQSERNLTGLFRQARAAAPCVLFLDELDALGHRRSRLSVDGVRRTVNQLLIELDGIGEDNEGVFALAATNQPWDIDTALRRPGRFDRTVLVLPPDAPARRAILGRELAGRPVGGVDLDRVAAGTDTWSGADLVHVVDSAAELALAESVDAGTVRAISSVHLERALDEVGPSTLEWFATARSVATASDDERMYGPLVEYLRHKRLI